jgi:hypothetical protein
MLCPKNKHKKHTKGFVTAIPRLENIMKPLYSFIRIITTRKEGDTHAEKVAY